MSATRRTIRLFGAALLLAALGVTTGPGRAEAQGDVLVPTTIAPSGYGYYGYGYGAPYGYGVSSYGGYGGVGFYGGGFSPYGGVGFYGPGYYGATGAAPTYQPYVKPQGGAGNTSFGVPQLNATVPQLNSAVPIRPQFLNGLPAFSTPR